ncbi:MAG: HAD family phosphatase [Fibrobacteres bacterium]|nr:HAD family phosphatase [Fibrobacterota bacterium]
MKIKTILFDLGNVLFPFNWSIAAEKFAKENGTTAEAVITKMKGPEYAKLFNDFGTGAIPTGLFINRLNEALCTKMSYEKASDIWCSIFTPDRDMLFFFIECRKKFKTFILSDTDTLHWNHLNDKWNLEDMVDGTILSFKYGMMKADTGAFAKIVKLYALEPQETIFIDDLQKNLDAAAKVGIQGILHTSYEDTMRQIVSYTKEL